MVVQRGEQQRRGLAADARQRQQQARLLREAERCVALSVPALALFPVVGSELKTPDGAEAWNPDGLVPRAIQRLKSALPDLAVITDVAAL